MTQAIIVKREGSYVVTAAGAEVVASLLAQARAVSGEVATVIENIDSITDVAANIPTINDVAGNAANINALAPRAADMATLAPRATDIATVAARDADLGVLAGDLSGADTIGTVATSIAEVEAVSGNIGDIVAVAGATGDMAAIVPALDDIAEVAATSGLAHPFDRFDDQAQRGAFLFKSDDKRVLDAIFDDGTRWAGVAEGSPGQAQLFALAEDVGFVTGHPFDRPGMGTAEGSPDTRPMILAARDAAGKALFGVAKDGSFWIGKYDPRIAAAVALAESAGGLPQTPIVREEANQIVAHHGPAEYVLTAAGNNRSPSIVGNEILFLSDRQKGALGTYRMNLDGSGQRALLPKRRYIWFGVYGQSDVISLEGGGGVETTPLDPGRALMLSGGPVSRPERPINTSTASLTDMASAAWAESGHPRMLHALIARLADDYPDTLFVSGGHGEAGMSYASLKKGTSNYVALMAQIQRVAALVGADNLFVPFIMWKQGGGDDTDPDYDLKVKELQSDLDADIRAITGQREPVMLGMIQQSYYRAPGSSALNARLAQLKACETSDRIFLLGPEYHYTYADFAHLLNTGQVRRGEYDAKIIYETIFQGLDSPIPVPIGFTLGANYVDVAYRVRHAPLQLSEALVTNPGNWGYQYSDAAGRTITGVTVRPDGKTIRVQLSGAIGATAVLAYALDNGGVDATAGPIAGHRGCLHDSDPAISGIDGTTHLYNVGAIFRQALN